MNRFRAVRKGTMYASRNMKDEEPTEPPSIIGVIMFLTSPFWLSMAIVAWHITIPACVVAYFVIRHAESKKG